MTVTRVAEHPRITKPFSDAAWDRLNALGHKVDDALEKGDVRLTMGGEPTFVSIDDFESDEWNTAAVGPQKRGLADDLIRRLQTRFAPGGFLHYGQGQVVSRRKPAALDVFRFTAAGWQTRLEEPRSDRAGKRRRSPQRQIRPVLS